MGIHKQIPTLVWMKWHVKNPKMPTWLITLSRYLNTCIYFRNLEICAFILSFGHYIFFPIYAFWLPLWNLSYKNIRHKSIGNLALLFWNKVRKNRNTQQFVQKDLMMIIVTYTAVLRKEAAATNVFFISSVLLLHLINLDLC